VCVDNPCDIFVHAIKPAPNPLTRTNSHKHRLHFESCTTVRQISAIVSTCSSQHKARGCTNFILSIDRRTSGTRPLGLLPLQASPIRNPSLRSRIVPFLALLVSAQHLPAVDLVRDQLTTSVSNTAFLPLPPSRPRFNAGSLSARIVRHVRRVYRYNPGRTNSPIGHTFLRRSCFLDSPSLVHIRQLRAFRIFEPTTPL
jgi:hypothetical protein